MTFPEPAGIAILGNGEKLLLPPGMTAEGWEYVVSHKPQILTRLRSTQMNKAGFYTQVTPTLLNELRLAPWSAIDIQTTAPTRFSRAIRVTKKMAIGGVEWQSYRVTSPACRLNSSPRVRVLGLSTEILGHCAWDLDALGLDERNQLITAALDGKIVVDHNIGTDLAWLFPETAARPSFVLDTMLLLRQMSPKVLLRPHKMAASSDPTLREMGENLLRQDDPASLHFAASCLQLPVPDTAYEAPSNWCVSVLSPGHLKHVEDSLGLPLTLLDTLMPGCPVEQMPDRLRHGFPWYLPYQSALVRLAEAHARGVPLDGTAAKDLKGELTADLNSAAAHLAVIPEFAGFDARLRDPHAGESDDLREAVANYAAERGVVLPRSAEGKPRTGKGSMAASGGGQLPASIDLGRVQSAKQGISLVDGYVRAAKADGRLHPLMNFDEVTGRASSTEPNLQGMPRDPRFRKLVRAKSGHVILSADYSAVELRIAAVLADRAIADVRSRIDAGEKSWFLDQVSVGLRASNLPPYPEEPAADFRPGIEWREAVLHSISYTVLHRPIQAMENAFRLGLDPHLVTAMDLARRSGVVEFVGDPLYWLAAKDGMGRKQSKEQFGEERQAAKAANFGLLYGMQAAGLHDYGVTDFGLSWTLEEASDTRRAWFELYPEFQLWHQWTKYCQAKTIAKDRCCVWGRGPAKNRLVTPDYDPKLFATTTLTGRPLAVMNDLNQALNYQDQGTGADILVRAIADLPPAIAAMMRMSVHDELVFEVPNTIVSEVQQTVEAVMKRAATEVLGPSTPVEVESVVGETWS